MYRIELAPGEETVFRTIEELAIGVRNGLVTPRCRIYHSASQKWLPIEFHPHYKKALALPASRVAEAIVPKSAHPPRLETLSFAVAPAPRPAAEPEAAPVPAPAAGPEPAAVPQPVALEDPVEAAPAAGPVAEAPNGGQAIIEPFASEHGKAEPEHPRPESMTLDHHAPDYPLGQHPFTQQPLTHQPVSPLPPEPQQPDPHRVAAHHRPATGAVLRDPFAPLAPTDGPATPASAKPAADHVTDRPQRPSASPYRPDSYLPPTVRIIADDPYVAIAPEATIAPAVDAPSIEAARATARPAHEPEPLELPKISYPEITPAEEPVAERAGPGRGRRPLQVAVAIVVLAAGGYLAKSFYSPVHRTASAPSAVRADRPELPKDGVAAAAAATASDARTATGSTSVGTIPAGGRSTPHGIPGGPAATPPAPASSGFAAALEPRAMASGPVPNLPASSGANVPPNAVKPDSATTPAPIVPPPADLQIDVPALPGGVPFVASPSGKNDSAMKRILRAVNGGKDAR